MPPAGVQKMNVCFACSSLCSHELDTILSNTVPLVWAESLWIAGKCWPKVAGFFANQASRTSERPPSIWIAMIEQSTWHEIAVRALRTPLAAA